MKIGVNLMLWSFAPTFSEHGKYVDLLAEMGFDAFEVCVHDLGAADVAGFARKARELNMTPQAIDVFSVDIGDMIGHDPASRRAAIQRIKEDIHKARDLGSEVLSGPFFQGLSSSTDVGPTADEWKWAVEGLAEVGREAKACGDLRIAAEPLNRFEMHIVNTVADAYRLCAETGMDNVGILADTHHANIEELDVVKAYTQHVDRIFNIHISENNRGIPGSGHGIPRELFKALEAAGYRGNLIIEAFNAEPGQGLPLLRIWGPYASSKEEICTEGLKFIRENLR